jgi:hypothetical protein
LKPVFRSAQLFSRHEALEQWFCQKLSTHAARGGVQAQVADPDPQKATYECQPHLDVLSRRSRRQRGGAIFGNQA